jgi:hypothetical protein
MDVNVELQDATETLTQGSFPIYGPRTPCGPQSYISDLCRCVPNVVIVHCVHTVHNDYVPAPHNHSQHNQASPHAVLNSLLVVLLMMGIMMPETW